MQAKPIACFDCDATARYLVLVPWFHYESGFEGSDWTPVCCAHQPTAEDWAVVPLRDMSADVLAYYFEENRFAETKVSNASSR
tara:strand:+ start:169 stop:417 length:249 start_codon:yes stop_codon:yes gene_type:complete